MNSPASTGRLAIDQDMTIYHAEALKSELMGNLENHQVIEMDLSQVAAIDTAGIQLLMLAKRECQKQDKTLRIVAHSPAVHELMDFFNIAGFFGDPLVIPARDVA
ncbi:MAG: STAS domain-containing protein [Betaproteobacteria bacterium]|nr:STAS domain-containing protein [Betaproteobacteria bacterium]